MSLGTAATRKQRLPIVGIVLCWMGFTYIPHWGFWISAVAAVGIMVLGGLAFGREWRTRLGLGGGIREALLFAGTVAVTIPAAALLVRHMAGAAGFGVTFDHILEQPGKLVFSTFQTLNEEMVVGALLLLALDRRFPGRRAWIGIAVAAVFALLHVVLYASPHQGWLGGTPETLAPLTVVSLFFVGIARNNMILARGDIALAWALHLGFNIPFLVGDIWSRDTGAYPSEPARFDAVFAHLPMVAVTAALAAVSFLFYLRPREG